MGCGLWVQDNGGVKGDAETNRGRDATETGEVWA